MSNSNAFFQTLEIRHISREMTGGTLGFIHWNLIGKSGLLQNKHGVITEDWVTPTALIRDGDGGKRMKISSQEWGHIYLFLYVQSGMDILTQMMRPRTVLPPPPIITSGTMVDVFLVLCMTLKWRSQKSVERNSEKSAALQWKISGKAEFFLLSFSCLWWVMHNLTKDIR